MKKLLFYVTVLTLLLAACSSDDASKGSKTTPGDSSDKLSIYTTVYPLQYFAERIGGDAVEVASIYPAGANEHTFEPTQKDMMSLADADLFFYVGLGLEGFLEKSKKTLANEGVKLVPTAEGVTEDQLHISTGHTHAEATEEDHDHDHDEDTHEDHADTDQDAHVWLSPIISQQLALSIKDELVNALPEQEATFTANYDQLVADLNTLNADFEEMAKSTSKKTFFVSHAAFGYIAGHYGFTQVPVAGLNSQSEPSQKELTAIVDLAKKENIEYMFFEQNVSSSLTEIIQKEIGAKPLILHNLSVLTKEDIANNEDYFTLMRKNIDVLKQALSN
ncbi:adhesin [Lysinibacillus sp. 2017]|uniref:metal ABC transporter solute-binding protein, Zn/Mn family n=1 Tax=unclassified Lysinibacillus TaxID=2636778 RepID=UPI000D528D2C|nr:MULTISPECIES: zinc ABC transporter substrate-binding protein [unclassified Lysinibacillus]AWE08413.1 adhesin [Lysinibacillus sp. 2017]TGN35740.1 adhesin [Lysinibacillus sp. S2017]